MHLANRQRTFASGKAIRMQLVILRQSFLYIYIQWLLYHSLEPNGLEIMLLTSTVADEPDLSSEGPTSSILDVPATPTMPTASAAGHTAVQRPLDKTFYSLPPADEGRWALRAAVFSVMPLIPAYSSSAQDRKVEVLPRSA